MHRNSGQHIQHKESLQFSPERGVRDYDIVFPKFVMAILGNIFNKLDWNNKGLYLEGEYLIHQRFAVNIVLIANSAEELHQQINEINIASN